MPNIPQITHDEFVWQEKKKLFRLETKSVRSPRLKNFDQHLTRIPRRHMISENLCLRSTFAQSFPAPTAPTARSRSWQARHAQDQRACPVWSIPPRHPPAGTRPRRTLGNWPSANLSAGLRKCRLQQGAAASMSSIHNFFFVAFAQNVPAPRLDSRPLGRDRGKQPVSAKG